MNRVKLTAQELLICFSLYLYFLFPKLGIYHLSDQVTPLRIQDLISFFAFFVVYQNIKIKHYLFPNFFILLFIFLNLFVNIFFTSQPLNILIGWARIYEYLVMSLLIINASFLINIDSFFKKIVFLNFFVGFFQYFKIFPNYDPGRNGILFSDQFSGLYGTPAEFSYGLLAMFFIFNQFQSFGIRNFYSFFILLNNVKASILSLFLIFFMHARKNYIIFLLAPFLVLLIFFSELAEFYLALTNNDFSYSIADLYKFDYHNLSELSLGQRVYKWGIAIYLVSSNLLNFLFGFGAYSAGPSLDGGVVKFLFEFGLFGYLGLLYFLRKIPLAFIFFLFSSNLLFDAYQSSITMPIYLAIFFRYRLASKF